MIRRLYRSTITAILLCLLAGFVNAQVDYNHQWSGFRGPWGPGYLEGSVTPEKWSLKRGGAYMANSLRVHETQYSSGPATSWLQLNDKNKT